MSTRSLLNDSVAANIEIDPDVTMPYRTSASLQSPPHRASTPLSDIESDSDLLFSALPSSSSTTRIAPRPRTVLQSEIDQYAAMFPTVPQELIRSTLLEYGSYAALDQFLLSNLVQQCTQCT